MPPYVFPYIESKEWEGADGRYTSRRKEGKERRADGTFALTMNNVLPPPSTPPPSPSPPFCSGNLSHFSYFRLKPGGILFLLLLCVCCHGIVVEYSSALLSCFLCRNFKNFNVGSQGKILFCEKLFLGRSKVL